jgi:hypothetical protein
LIVDNNSKRSSLTTKILRSLCVGYVVLFDSWLAFSFAGMSWESFHPGYRLPQVASGLKSAALALALSVLAAGVAFGRRWARWASIALAALGLCLSVLLFWDGYLRIKSKYSGEESSEVFMALVFSVTSLSVLAAMSVPAAKSYFAKTLSQQEQPEPRQSLDPTP